MGMEHRWCGRTPVSLDLVIRHKRLGLVHGHVRDISISGMFVVSEAAFGVGDPVEVTLVVRDRGVIHLRRIKAVAARVAAAGTAFVFDQFMLKEYSLLVALGATSGPQHESVRHALHAFSPLADSLKAVTCYLMNKMISRMPALPSGRVEINRRLAHHPGPSAPEKQPADR